MDHFILKRGKNKDTCTVVTSHQILDEKLKSSFYIILFIIMIKPRCWKANKSVQPWQLISGWYMFLKISTLISVPVFVYYHKCFTLINLSVTWCKLIKTGEYSSHKEENFHSALQKIWNKYSFMKITKISHNTSYHNCQFMEICYNNNT